MFYWRGTRRPPKEAAAKAVAKKAAAAKKAADENAAAEKAAAEKAAAEKAAAEKAAAEKAAAEKAESTSRRTTRRFVKSSSSSTGLPSRMASTHSSGSPTASSAGVMVTWLSSRAASWRCR